MALSLREMNTRAVTELSEVINRINDTEVAQLLNQLAAAGRIACYGVGREGLMIKALAMRLFHLGLDCHVVGDMTTPPLGAGDLLLISAGPGYFSTVAALTATAQKDGATVACFTAQPAGEIPLQADLVVTLPAQTMADDSTAPSSFLPMGSLYEGVQFLFYEYLILLLRDRLKADPIEMRGRHTNLE
jgi:6-phospho-3-hexuloisomerase